MAKSGRYVFVRSVSGENVDQADDCPERLGLSPFCLFLSRLGRRHVGARQGGETLSNLECLVAQLPLRLRNVFLPRTRQSLVVSGTSSKRAGFALSPLFLEEELFFTRTASL